MIVAIIIGLTPSTIESRTIMVYMPGSNLESDAGIATADLSSIVPSEVDLNTINNGGKNISNSNTVEIGSYTITVPSDLSYRL